MAAANPIPFPEPTGPETHTLKPWQHNVIDLLTQGASIAAAMRHVGYSIDNFYKTCARHPEFKAQANIARELHRAEVSEAFHDAEAMARTVVFDTLNNEQLPANLRLRAALAILNRKGDHWLPSPILHPEPNSDDLENLTKASILDIAETTDNIDNQDTANSTDNIDNLDTIDKPDPAPAASNLPAGEAIHTRNQDNRENTDTLDNLDNIAKGQGIGEEDLDPDLVDCLGSRDMAAYFTDLLRAQAEANSTELDSTDNADSERFSRAEHQAS
ncbi:MAG: hypothetical protein U5J83_02925 [Bryobacterales bacterium]|nr:hypothetical protein [Bryobacterales bacterium]